jgi:hypothetical protein
MMPPMGDDFLGPSVLRVQREAGRKLEETLLDPDSARCVLVEAQQGFGKSVLIQQALATIDASAWTALGRAERIGIETDQLLPFRDVLIGLTSRGESIPAGALEKARTLASKAAELMPDVAALLFGPLGLVVKAGQIGYGMHRERNATAKARSEFVQSLESFMEELTDNRPVVIAIDDFHWADGATSDLVLYLARRLDEMQYHFKIALTCRPDAIRGSSAQEVLSELTRESQVAELALSPFSVDEITGLLRIMWEGADVDPGLPRFLWERSGGVPLFVEQWLRFLIEHDAVAERAGTTYLEHRQIPDSLPSTLNRLVASRLDRLGEEGLELLSAGAVFGEKVLPELVASLLRRDPDEVGMDFGRLSRRSDILEEATDGSFRFSHAVLREAAYARLSGSERRVLHGRAAHALRDLGADAGVVGEHLRLAGNLAEAAPMLVAAAHEEKLLGSYRSAISRLEKVPAPADETLRTQFFTTLVGSQIGSGEIPQALETIAAWRSTAPESEALRAQEGELLHVMGRFRDASTVLRPLVRAGHEWAAIRDLNNIRMVDLARAEERADELLSKTDWSSCSWLLLRYVAAGAVLLPRNRLGEAVVLLEVVVEDCESAGDDDLASAAHRRLVDIAHLQGRSDVAASHLHRARVHAELSGSRQRLCIDATRAEHLRQRGDPERAAVVAAHAAERFATACLPVWRAHAILVRAAAERDLNRNSTDSLNEAAQAYDQLGLHWGKWQVELARHLNGGADALDMVAAAEEVGLLAEAGWLRASADPSQQPLALP